jgi:SAM-dependent MidA family methyltransferase
MSAAVSWPWNDDSPLRFDRFMDRALHDPERGYYARRIRGVGQSGDFTTTPMLSSALARAIAAWANRAMTETGCRDLIEAGPGEGKLAAEVLRALPFARRWRTRLHLVERSLPLREKQQALLGRKARWHDTLEAALDACGGRAWIFSNELIDAFPVRRFRRENEGWSELFLSPGDPPGEVWQPATELPSSVQFSDPHPAGQILEVHDSVHQWLNGWLPYWQAGAMLTIDYGSENGELYHRRPHGTLRGYYLQQRLEGSALYQYPGRRDLTADVDFRDLAAWTHDKGETRFQSQREFLLPHADARNPADATLLDPAGAGEAFRVWELKRNSA